MRQLSAMLESSEQVRPFSPAADQKETATTTAAAIRSNRCIKCCGYVAALLLIPIIVVVTLAFTVFKPKAPAVRVEKLTVGNLELANCGNVSLNVGVWVKNSNFVSFKYENMATTLFYRGVAVGESQGPPPGRAAARRTARINFTVDIMVDRILSRPRLLADINSGLVNVSSSTRVGGRIEVFVFEKHVTVKMNCNVSMNIARRSIQQHKCKWKIKLI